MSYQYTQEELYNRALFTIKNQMQDVYVAFEPNEGDSYLMIIYSSDGSNIVGYHEKPFWDTLFQVLSDFDNNRKLDYEIIAV
ncbi:hypothetical protein ACFQ1R_13065 [Mariniflexile jejuense]|uniref:KTSC domain-containing protein n=1 Tax=Mariniflexile jejuense TaxID=1173582 RepID=A0ABW3JKR0_9FLAO